MILRVPDYYDEFTCIADQCKDSCCIGWEIDIDEDTETYYRGIQGEIGQRLRENMYQTEDGCCSFRLKEHGRCPFLNGKNLCDLCIHLGEESLSEVCTEYPRFALDYGTVCQKVLSLSCEEAGRILFTREEAVSFREIQLPEMEVWMDEMEDHSWYHFLEQVQENAITMLQDRSRSIWERMDCFLSYMEKAQQLIDLGTWADARGEECLDVEITPNEADTTGNSVDPYERFQKRFEIFESMESLGGEWIKTKNKLRETLTPETYEEIQKAYLASSDYREVGYEHLMVYFVFRYLMRAVYDRNLLSKGNMAVGFTRMIRDMDAVRYRNNGGFFTMEDRIDTARIFSKEVEHLEENLAYAENAFYLSRRSA